VYINEGTRLRNFVLYVCMFCVAHYLYLKFVKQLYFVLLFLCVNVGNDLQFMKAACTVIQLEYVMVSLVHVIAF